MMEWRSLGIVPEHEISEDGQIRRRVAGRCWPAGMILKPYTLRNGYAVVSVKGSDGQVRTRYVHRLVCEAFHGPCPSDKQQAAHGDGDPSNNHYTNLRWATVAENHADRRRHGTTNPGERSPTAKLAWEDVRKIRAEYNGAWGQKAALARRYGVDNHTLRDVLDGKTWRDPEAAA